MSQAQVGTLAVCRSERARDEREAGKGDSTRLLRRISGRADAASTTSANQRASICEPLFVCGIRFRLRTILKAVKRAAPKYLWWCRTKRRLFFSP